MAIEVEVYNTQGHIEKKEVSQLKDIQDIVGGYIEIVFTENRKNVLIVNEEGIPLGLTPNPHPAYHSFYGNVILAPLTILDID